MKEYHHLTLIDDTGYPVYLGHFNYMDQERADKTLIEWNDNMERILGIRPYTEAKIG